jgi:hypothetical protein
MSRGRHGARVVSSPRRSGSAPRWPPGPRRRRPRSRCGRSASRRRAEGARKAMRPLNGPSSAVPLPARQAYPEAHIHLAEPDIEAKRRQGLVAVLSHMMTVCPGVTQEEVALPRHISSNRFSGRIEGFCLTGGISQRRACTALEPAVLGVDQPAQTPSSRLHLAGCRLLSYAYDLASVALCLAFGCSLLSSRIRLELALNLLDLASELAFGPSHRRAHLRLEARRHWPVSSAAACCPCAAQGGENRSSRTCRFHPQEG